MIDLTKTKHFYIIKELFTKDKYKNLNTNHRFLYCILYQLINRFKQETLYISKDLIKQICFILNIQEKCFNKLLRDLIKYDLITKVHNSNYSFNLTDTTVYFHISNKIMFNKNLGLNHKIFLGFVKYRTNLYSSIYYKNSTFNELLCIGNSSKIRRDLISMNYLIKHENRKISVNDVLLDIEFNKNYKDLDSIKSNNINESQDSLSIENKEEDGLYLQKIVFDSKYSSLSNIDRLVYSALYQLSSNKKIDLTKLPTSVQDLAKERHTFYLLRFKKDNIYLDTYSKIKKLTGIRSLNTIKHSIVRLAKVNLVLGHTSSERFTFDYLLINKSKFDALEFIPQKITDCKHSINEKLILCLILQFYTQYKKFDLSNLSISNTLNISTSEVKNTLSKLKKEGLIIVSKSNNQYSTRTITPDSDKINQSNYNYNKTLENTSITNTDESTESLELNSLDESTEKIIILYYRILTGEMYKKLNFKSKLLLSTICNLISINKLKKYYNELNYNHNKTLEFNLYPDTIAEWFGCSTLTIKRAILSLIENKFLENVSENKYKLLCLNNGLLTDVTNPKCNQYIKIDKEILHNKNLNNAEKIILPLFKSMDSNSKDIYMSTKKISELTGINYKSVQTALRHLKELNLINIEYKKRGFAIKKQDIKFNQINYNMFINNYNNNYIFINNTNKSNIIDLSSLDESTKQKILDILHRFNENLDDSL